MSGPSTIHSLFVDSRKHAIIPTKPATRACASIAITKGSAFYTSSPKPTWIIDSNVTDHMTFDLNQVISCTPTTQLVVSNANGKTNSTTWTRNQIVRPSLVKLSQQVELVQRDR
ncbi:unnamed protein product [Prunus armeniaca]